VILKKKFQDLQRETKPLADFTKLQRTNEELQSKINTLETEKLNSEGKKKGIGK